MRYAQVPATEPKAVHATRRASASVKHLLVIVASSALVALLSPAGSAKTVLKVLPWGGMGDRNKGGLLEQVIAEYKKVRPDVEIEVLGQIPTYDFLPKLLLMPEMPDIVETHLGWFPELMKAGIPSPLPQDLEQQARRFFFAPTLVPFTYSGRLYGIPTEYQLYALGYNRRLFDEAGLAGPPQTWEELRLMAAKGTRRNAEGTITRIGFRFPGLGWASGGESQTHTFLAFLHSNNGTYIDSQGNPGLDRPEAVETMEFLVDLIRAQVAAPNGWFGIPEGTAFMVLFRSSVRGGLVQAMGDDFANVTSSLIPRGKGSFATTQYGWGFIVPTRAKNAKEAWEFLRWLTMQEGPNGLTRTGLAMANLGSIPTNPVDLRARRELQTQSFWKGFLEGLNYARPEPPYPQIFTRWKELGKALEPVLRLEIPPQQGLAEAQRRIRIVLEQGKPAD